MSKVEGRGPIVPSPPQVFVKLFFNLNSRFLGIRPDTRCNTARNIAGKVENAPPLCQLSEIVARNIAEALLYSTSVTLHETVSRRDTPTNWTVCQAQFRPFKRYNKLHSFTVAEHTHIDTYI